MVAGRTEFQILKCSSAGDERTELTLSEQTELFHEAKRPLQMLAFLKYYC